MSSPYSITGSLSFVPDSGLAALAIPLLVSGQFDESVSLKLDIAAAGDTTVPVAGLGSGTGLKALLVKLDAGSVVSPIIVKLNGAVTGAEVSGGGFVLISNPTPTSGVTAVVVTAGSACTVRAWALG